MQTIGTLAPINSIWSLEHPDNYLESAKDFISWLSESGQNAWQMLPLSATHWGSVGEKFSSPYYSYGVGLNPQFLPKGIRNGPFTKATPDFLEKNSEWIFDYGKFLALAEKNGTDFWPDWKLGEEQVDPERIDLFIDQQAFLHNKFSELVKFSREKGVEIWGDVPFYLPINSPLVWAHKEAFLMDKNGKMDFVAGSSGGKHFKRRQVWGFPLYNFENSEGMEKALEIWKIRTKYFSSIYSMARLDAAVRFFAWQKISLKNSDFDEHNVGPGEDFFQKVVQWFRSVGGDVYIEDISGHDMTEMHRVAKDLNIAGVSVFSMILATDSLTIDPVDFDLSSFSKNHVYFTSTHDTKPMVAYLKSLNSEQLELVSETFRVEKSDPSSMALSIRKELLKRCKIILVSLPDWSLSEHRINEPGTLGEHNWNYKMEVPVEKLPKKI